MNRYFFYTAWIIVAASFLWMACLPEPLPVKGIPQIKPQIVVTSQIIPEQGLVILLTKSFGALDADEDSDPEELLAQLAISDALVILKGPEQTDTLVLLESGIYGGVTELEENEEYELMVQSPTMGEVTARTLVKPQVLFTTIEAEKYFDGFDDTLVQVSYTLQDPPESNKYMINVKRIRQADLENDVLNPSGFTRLVEDIEFNGASFGETFRSFPRDFQTGDTVAVYLSNISEEYYEFMKLRQDNRFTFIEFISEPIHYPSNVNNGLGFFNLYVPDVRLLVLD